MSNYAIVYEAPVFPGDNWSAYPPDLPGCAAVGDTRAECRENMAEAIRLHVADLRDKGEVVPLATSEVEFLAVAA